MGLDLEGAGFVPHQGLVVVHGPGLEVGLDLEAFRPIAHEGLVMVTKDNAPSFKVHLHFHGLFSFLSH